MGGSLRRSLDEPYPRQALGPDLASRVRTVCLGGALASFVLTGFACASSQKRGLALYDGEQERSRVSQISTQVASVDGVEIPEGISRVEVLPGCHEVILDRRWIYTENGAHAYMDTGGAGFRFDTKPGHSYIIDAQFGAGNTTAGFSVKWLFKQIDAEGNEVPWEFDGTCGSL